MCVYIYLSISIRIYPLYIWPHHVAPGSRECWDGDVECLESPATHDWTYGETHWTWINGSHRDLHLIFILYQTCMYLHAKNRTDCLNQTVSFV